MARSVDGNTNKITASSNTSALNFTPPLSFSVWLYPTSFVPPAGTLMNAWIVQGGGFYGMYFVQNGSQGAVSLQGNTSLNTNIQTVNTNAWSHFGGRTTGAANQGWAYWNGVKDSAVGQWTWVGVGSSTLSISYDSVTANRFYTGRVADLAIWNVTLTDGEFLALGQGAKPYTIRPTALAGYWPLDGLQSPEPDLSGNRANGTLTGTSLAAGPPTMMFTPRSPQTLAAAAASTTVFRRTLSSIGTRTGTRQAVG